MRDTKTRCKFTVRDRAGKPTGKKLFYVDTKTGGLTDSKGKKITEVMV